MKKSVLAFTFLSALFLLSCNSDDSKADSTSATNNSGSNSSGSSSNAVTPGSPEEFAGVLASYVIDSNLTGIDSLIILHDEMQAVISGSNVTPAGKEAAISHIDTEIGKMKNDMRNGLADIRMKGKANNIVWMGAKFKNARYSVAKPNGYEMMQLTCIIDFNGVEYPFTVTDVVHTSDGWKLGGKMYYGSDQH